MPASRLLCLVIAASTLLSTPAVAQTYLEPSDEAPHFRISNFRVARDIYGKAMMTADYVRTKQGQGTVTLEVMGRNGRVQMLGGGASNYNRASGTIELSLVGIGPSEFDYEIYFLTNARWAGKSYGSMLVSNAARLGNPRSNVSKRPWKDEEKAAHEKNKLRLVPPAEVPDGYSPIYANTPLAAGMPIKAGWYGDWRDAEYLGKSDGDKFTIRFAESSTATTVDRVDWVVASRETLERAAADPSQFHPSIRVLASGGSPLPNDAVPVPRGQRMPAGTPLLKLRALQWTEVFVVDDNGDSISVISANTRDFHGKAHRNVRKLMGRLGRRTPREELAIKRTTLATLEDPKAARRLATNLQPHANGKPLSTEDLETLKEDKITVQLDKRYKGGGSGTYSITDRDYEIDEPIPSDSQIVPPDVELPVGTQVAYCWGRDWEPAIVLGDRGNLMIVMEDDNHWSFAYRVARSQLIILNKDLERISRSRGEEMTSLKQTLRTWTDASGQHKVEAFFVRISDDLVTLKTDAGREISLPLQRLCEKDQELIKLLPAEADNPFE